MSYNTMRFLDVVADGFEYYGTVKLYAMNHELLNKTGASFGKRNPLQGLLPIFLFPLTK
jgi:hypothetical protein